MKLEQFQQYARDFLLPLALAQAGPLVRPLPGSSELRSPDELAALFQDAYDKALQAAFAKVATPPVRLSREEILARKKGKKAGGEKFASTLSLVDEHTLDSQLKTERHGREMQLQLMEPLQYLSIRIERLGGQQFEISANPLHPQQLAHCLRMGCEATTKNGPALQAAIDRWIALATKSYGSWIAEWNDWLVGKGVLPWLDQDGIEERYLRQEEEQARAREIRKEVIGSITGKTLGENDAIPPTAEIMQQLALLIKNASLANPGMQAHMFTGKPGGEQADYETVQAELGKITALDVANIPCNADTGYIEPLPPSNLAEVITENTSLGDKALDDQTQGTVTLLSMLFERFQQDDNIAPPIRTLMAGLQVPMLQSALADPDFLIDSDSPAQQMLNEIGKLGAQWSAKPDANRDIAYKKLVSIVEDVQEKSRQGEDAFAENLYELQSFIEAEERKAALLNERAIAAEQARARMEAATRNAQQAVTGRINHLTLPVHAAGFIQDTWQRVLFFLYNKDPDAQQEATRRALACMDTVLDAAQGKATPDIDALIQQIDQQMIDVGREEPIPKPRLAALGAELKAIADARRQQEAAAALQAAVPAPQAGDAHTAAMPPDALAASQVPVVEVSLPEPEPAPETEPAAEDHFDQLAANLHANSWFMYHASGTDTVTKIKLAAIIKHNLMHVFVTREGAKALGIHRNEVAAKLRSHELQLIESSAMFERTLATLITSMRR